MQKKFELDQWFFLVGLVLLTINASLFLMINKKLFYLIKIIIAVLFVLAILLKKWSVNEIVEVLFVFSIIIVSYYQTKTTDIIYLYLTIVASRGANFRLSVKIATFIRAIGFLGTILLSCLGFISSFTSYRGEEVRYSLGYLHPNLASSNFFFIILGVIFLYYKRFNVISYVCIITSLVVVSELTGNRTDLVLGILLVISLLLRDYIPNFLVNINWWLIVFFISVSTAYIYTLHPIGILNSINNLLAGRLYQASDFINMYTPNLFGNKLKLMSTISSDFTSGIGNAGRVYILDNMYVNLLLQRGILITIWVILNVRKLLTLEIQKLECSQQNDGKIICIYFMIFAVFAITENTPLSIDYNIFLILFANNISNWTKKGRVLNA